jgi:hypothetical protein
MIACSAVTIGLFVASQSLGGSKAVSATSGAELSQTESGRAIVAMRAGGAGSLPDELDVAVTSQSLKVTDPAFWNTVATIVSRLQEVTASVDGRPGPARPGPDRSHRYGIGRTVEPQPPPVLALGGPLGSSRWCGARRRS